MIEKMNPHYGMTSPSSIYDEEALTALELAGRTAKKTNEIIEEVNKVRKDTDDFIDKTENETIPDMVKNTFENHIENGGFDAQINTYMGDIETRVNNLLSSIPEGGTSMDAEVIDGRVGADGKTYPNLGEATRTQFKNMSESLTACSLYRAFRLRTGSTDGATGNFGYDTAIRATFSAPVRVNKGDTIYFDKDCGYKYSVLFYNLDGTSTGNTTDYLTTNYTFDRPYIVGANFMKNDNSTVDLNVIYNAFKIGSITLLNDSIQSVAMETLDTTLETFGMKIKRPRFVGGDFDGLYALPQSRLVSDDFISVSRGDEIILTDNGIYNYGFRLYSPDKVYDGIDRGWNSTRFTIPSNGFIKIMIKRVDENTMDMDESLKISNMCFVISNKYSDVSENGTRDSAINSIMIENGRHNEGNYIFAKIPKYTVNGEQIKPKIRLTSIDGTLTGEKTTPLEYAKRNGSVFVTNGGLFDMTAMIPLGKTIINGVSITDSAIENDNGYPISDEECYPLCIDASGNLSAPYDRNVSTSEMIQNGVFECITGWVKLVENYVILPDEIEKEIRHKGKQYARQVIGQYNNGDYCILTCGDTRSGNPTDKGLTYTECAEILVSKGVKFAYTIDGGGSAMTVIGNRQMTDTLEGANGRAVPSVIEFVVV